MVIRKAKETDIEQLVKIRMEYLNEDYEGLTEEQTSKLMEQLPDYFTNHLGKDMFVYLACEGIQILSSVFLVIVEKPANPSFITGKTGTILNVFTKPEYRRQGIAEQLMRMALKEAKEMNLSFLDLSATKAGHPLYKKLGFEEVKSNCVPMKYIFR